MRPTESGEITRAWEPVAHRRPYGDEMERRPALARALITGPKLIVADEPVSALDVSVQKQVLDLLNQLRKQFGLSMLFITHDLRVAATVCEEIAA